MLTHFRYPYRVQIIWIYIYMSIIYKRDRGQKTMSWMIFWYVRRVLYNLDYIFYIRIAG